MAAPNGNELLRWLLPADMERNPAFQEELLRLSRTGLRILGAMEAAIAVCLLAAGGGGAVFSFWLVIGVGAATMFAAQAKRVRMRVRLVAVLSGWFAAAALIEPQIWIAGGPASSALLDGDLALVLLAVVSAVQLIPLQACALGSAIGLLYAITAPMAGAWDSSLAVFILLLTCFATLVSALLYARRRDTFEEHLRMVEFRETIAAAQSRAQLAETAIAVGRLAGAITHEINTPLGALKSALDTMMVIARKQETANPDERARLVRAQDDLRRSINDSAERLTSVVERLKRLIALDHSEKREVNINDLVSGAGLTVADLASGRITTSWRLGDVPPVVCSMDQMTTALGNLFRNAVSAIDGEGAVEVWTTASESSVEICIHDTGRGMEPDEAATIFEPGFKVKNGRVLGGNWSLFTTRQIVHEHGGEIWLDSEPGGGTTVHVTLPASRTA